MFEIGKRYSFTTIAPVTLGAVYSNVKATANLTFDLAIKFADIISIRNKIKQETDINLLDPRDVLYTMFETVDKKTIVLANDWINTSSITLIDSIVANIRIENITTEDIINIRNMLEAMGYKNFDIDTTSTSE